MRMVVFFIGRVIHRPRSRHAHATRPENGIVIDMRRITVTELGEKLPVDCDANPVAHFLDGDLAESQRAEYGCGKREGQERDAHDH